MKKTTIMTLCLAACLAVADTKITWLADVTADRAETVTGVQSNQIRDAAAHIVRADNPHGVTAVQIGALTAELDPVANAALVGHMNRTDNPHGVTASKIGALTAEADPVAGPRLDLIEPATNKWNAAYSWGDHTLVGYLLPAALAPYATTAALAVHTNRIDNPHSVTAVQIGALTAESDPVANAALAVHANRVDNPHVVTAAQIGALTVELDLAALAADRFIPIDAGKNVISTDAGANANTTQSILIGDRAGNVVTGSTIIAIGRDAAREIVPLAGIVPETELSTIAIGENAAEQAGGIWSFAYNIAIGNSAFKEGAGQSSIAIGLDAGRTAAAQHMIAIGSDAGRTAAAQHMIAIGYQAGEQAGLTNSVVIGANAGRLASGQNILVIDSSGNDDSSYPARAMIYGKDNNLTLGRIDSDNNVLRGNWLFNNNRILTNETDEAAFAALNATNAVLRAAIINEAALRAAHIARTDNPHGVTAAQIGALTAVELDPVANAALAVHTNRIDNPHGVTAVQIGALTAELDPVANAALVVHTNRIDNPHSVTAVQIGALTAELDPVANAALVVHTNRVDNPHSVTAVQIGAITAELDPVANAALVVHTNRADNPHSVTAVQIGALTHELDPVANAALVVHTNRADNPHGVTAVQIGALTHELDPVANAALAVHTNRADNPHGVTAVQIGALTAESDPVANAALVVHKNRTDNPHGVTAAQIGALTTETDTAALAALAAYAAYWPRNATASSRFTFTTNSGAITITGYNTGGGTDVVIPDYINGWPVTEIGANAFKESGVTSIGGAGNVVTVGNNAFSGCTSLASVLLPQVQTVGLGAFEACALLASVPLPQVQTIGLGAFSGCTSLASVSLPQVLMVGAYAFYYCTSLTSVYFDDDAPAIGAGIFAEITPNQVTNYVTNPQATGWGEKFDDMPVVRLPLYADAIYQAGELVATTQHVAQAIAAIPEPDLSDHPTFSQIAATNALPYTAWTGTITPANGTATVTIAHGNMPVLVTAAPCVLTLDPTGYGTAGVSRVSLSYYTGGNSLTFSTDVIQYAETPTVDTSGWNTLLIRRVSNGVWKGVGL